MVKIVVPLIVVLLFLLWLRFSHNQAMWTVIPITIILLIFSFILGLRIKDE